MAGEANLRAGGVLDLLTGRGSSRYPWTRGKRGLIGLLRIVAATLLILPSPASAQTVTASLSGTVVDSSGAVIPGAQVSLVDEATGSKHVATANGGGRFSYTAIFPSTYDLTVTARGFSTWQAKGIVLHQNESRAISDITLKPGAASQEITVEATTQTVPVDTGASSMTRNMPMDRSRLARSASVARRPSTGRCMVTPATAALTRTIPSSTPRIQSSGNPFNTIGTKVVTWAARSSSRARISTRSVTRLSSSSALST